MGLKSENLLASQLTEKERIDHQIDEPFFSPNLQMWSTPLNTKILVTESIGVDKKLEEDILARIRRKAKRMENILGESFETNQDKAFISIQGNEGNHTRYKVNSQDRQNQGMIE